VGFRACSRKTIKFTWLDIFLYTAKVHALSNFDYVVAEEMDWDRNGMVNFKEFLFAFTHWVGIEDNEDEDGEEDT
jgi:hypothetical protein